VFDFRELDIEVLQRFHSARWAPTLLNCPKTGAKVFPEISGPIFNEVLPLIIVPNV
jgi:hypothetical protein